MFFMRKIVFLSYLLAAVTFYKNKIMSSRLKLITLYFKMHL